MSEVKQRRRLPRLTAFRAGVIAGVLSPFVAVLTFSGLIRLLLPAETPPKFNVRVEAVGQDVSRGGAKVIVVNYDHGALTQTCIDGCDDLRVDEDSGGDNFYRVNLLDSAGRCVVCDVGQYVTGGYGADITRWRVSGPERLMVQTSLLRRQPNGSLKEGAVRIETASGPPAAAQPAATGH